MFSGAGRSTCLAVSRTAPCFISYDCRGVMVKQLYTAVRLRGVNGMPCRYIGANHLYLDVQCLLYSLHALRTTSLNVLSLEPSTSCMQPSLGIPWCLMDLLVNVYMLRKRAGHLGDRASVAFIAKARLLGLLITKWWRKRHLLGSAFVSRCSY